MTLIKRNSFLPVFPQFFDDFFTKDLSDLGNWNHSSGNSTLPAVNIVESNDGFIVEMAAPGMDKKDFLIELDNGTLTISSNKASSGELNEGDRFIRREYNYLSFKRSFTLRKSVVNDAKIKASYENGVLRVLIPKKEEAKTLPPRQIAIS